MAGGKWRGLSREEGRVRRRREGIACFAVNQGSAQSRSSCRKGSTHSDDDVPVRPRETITLEHGRIE